jgi:hypothetical protein|tara:strand:+ start:117 stop:545 length:429 start_codon:yes stop_codon:yes gene_type:complete
MLEAVHSIVPDAVWFAKVKISQTYYSDDGKVPPFRVIIAALNSLIAPATSFAVVSTLADCMVIVPLNVELAVTLKFVVGLNVIEPPAFVVKELGYSQVETDAEESYLFIKIVDDVVAPSTTPTNSTSLVTCWVIVSVVANKG